MQAGRGEEWRAAVDAAHSLGADAVIMADAGLLGYAGDRYPDLRLHLSVQGSATHADAIELMKEQFGIKRVVLPRVLTLAEIARICGQVSVEVEVFGFGSLCVMAGAAACCRPTPPAIPQQQGRLFARARRALGGDKGRMDARLNGILIDRYEPGEPAAYPTLCKGRFKVDGADDHALEEPTSLNAIGLLPRLAEMGVSAVKIEGRQRSRPM